MAPDKELLRVRTGQIPVGDHCWLKSRKAASPEGHTEQELLSVSTKIEPITVMASATSAITTTITGIKEGGNHLRTRNRECLSLTKRPKRSGFAWDRRIWMNPRNEDVWVAVPSFY